MQELLRRRGVHFFRWGGTGASCRMIGSLVLLCHSLLVAWQCMLYVQMRDSFASRDCLRCEHSTIQSWRAHFSSQFYYRQCLVNGSRRWLTSASKILELATGCHAASTDTLIRVDGWPQMCSEVMSLNGHVLTGSKQILVNPIQRAVCNM